jgi:hypothetical protein
VPAGPPELTGVQEYTSAEQIADDLAERGHECRYEKRQGAMFATSSGSCWMGDHELVLSVYTTQDLAEESLEMNQLFEDAGLDYGVVVGNRWTVNCGSRDECLPFQDALGGRLVAPLKIG